MSGRVEKGRAPERLVVILTVATLVAASTGLFLLSRSASQVDGPSISGIVVGPEGQPVADARVSAPGARMTTTDQRGFFSLPTGPAWVTVEADGWLPRTRTVGGRGRKVVRLAQDLPGTVTFAFGGDVMFGRRFYDPYEDGSSRDALLDESSSAEDHLRLLEGIAPVFREADIAAVNLETPLTTDPYPDPREPRPSTFHPTKDYVFSSAPSAADALAGAGIDVIGIANNHLFDRLQSGVAETRTNLERAGYDAGSGFFGAGASSDQAWQPAVVEAQGQQVAFVGCTSILGDDQFIDYVAGKAKGGAAACESSRLRAEVRAADRASDIVVVMVHGGFEYARAPSSQIRSLSDIAVAAGATMVINHHPHVVGGLRFANGKLTAWTLGNLLFDQKVWPTFESYVLRVAVREGRVVSAWTEPVRLENYQPTGLFGQDASWVARGARARSEGPWVVDDGSLWLDRKGAAVVRTRTYDGPGIARVVAGCPVTGTTGRELLWSGDFEGRDLAGAEQTAGEDSGDATAGTVDDGAAMGVGRVLAAAPLWNVDKTFGSRTISAEAAHHGRAGIELTRTSGSSRPVVLTPQHRVLVDEGHDLTLLLDHRAASGDPRAEVKLSWYNDTKGGSQEVITTPVTGNDGQWRTLRVDARVPANAVAVQPFVLLSPAEGVAARLHVDDVALVDWSEPGCDYVKGAGELVDQVLPPSTGLALVPVAAAEPQPVTVPALPPIVGPVEE